MGNTNAATPLIHPSQNDVNGGVTNDGKRLLEKYIREWHKAINGISYQLTGNALPTSAANLVLIVPAGSAYISGYYVTWAQTNVTLPSSSTSHLFVKLIFSSGLVSNVQIEDNTSGTYPADAIKLGTVVTSGSAITSSTDQRLLEGNQRIRRAVISATGSTSWIVPANVTKIRVRQWGAGGGGGGGGGGDGGSYSGGNGSSGYRGGYWEAVVSVTPGATITVINGTGGAGGSGGGSGSDGGAGSSGGSSSASGTGFSFTAAGGNGGDYGRAAVAFSSNGANGGWTPYADSSASASSGTLDTGIQGGGKGPGLGGSGSTGSGTAGAAGQNAATIIDY